MTAFMLRLARSARVASSGWCRATAPCDAEPGSYGLDHRRGGRVRARRRAAARARALPTTFGERVRNRLPAGGNGIRTFGLPQDRPRLRDCPFASAALPFRQT